MQIDILLLKTCLNQNILFQITFLLTTILTLGAITKFHRSEPLWIAFHVGQGLQGILIAMLVTCNCQVLKLYTKNMTKVKKSKLGASSIISRGATVSKTTSLQLLTWDPAPDSV